MRTEDCAVEDVKVGLHIVDKVWNEAIPLLLGYVVVGRWEARSPSNAKQPEGGEEVRIGIERGVTVGVSNYGEYKNTRS